MECLRHVVASVFFVFIFFIPISQSYASAHHSSATLGQFEVNSAGNASYAIPIEVPPGTAGMQPTLSLSYNSQGGNGLLGVGWSLSGLSAVHRCGGTIAQDGKKSGVSYTNEDKLCLDGQRLIAINGTDIWAESTEYRTEKDNFTKIVSYRDAVGQPLWFKAWTKAGLIVEYGHTAVSAIEAQGKTEIRVWAINKISDTVGNYMTFTYVKDNAIGEYYPTQIDYTGNDAAVLSPYASVQFSYETRTDAEPQYVGGSMVKTTQRMINIKTFMDNVLVRDYRLAYENTGSIELSKMNSLTECAGDGVTCKEATTFDWQDSTGNLGTKPSETWASNINLPSLGIGVEASYWLGDVNGDGYDDLVTKNTDVKMYVGLSSGDTFTEPLVQWGSDVIQPNINSWQTWLADVDGDGKDDLIIRAQFNENGAIAGNIYVHRSLGNDFAPGEVWASVNEVGGIKEATVGDANGDGKADLVFLKPDGTYHIGLSTGSDFSAFNQWGTGVVWGSAAIDVFHSPPAMADVNGDGRDDLVLGVASVGSGVYVYLSTGNDFKTGEVWTNSTDVLRMADVNGDGKSDLLDGIYGVRISNGKEFGPLGAYVDLGRIKKVGDINGDGKDDTIVYINQNLYIDAYLTKSPTPDLLTTITNGLGNTTTIGYKPLTDDTVYTPDTGATYPIRDIHKQGPMYVVDSYNTSDGLVDAQGQPTSYSYTLKYGGAKADLDGRGMLGFRWKELTDTRTGFITRSEFNQSFPTNGLSETITTRKADTTVIDRTSNSWQSNPYTETGGTRYVISLQETTKETRELDGSLISSTTTSNLYDEYGNVTQITVATDGGYTSGGYTKTTVNTYDNNPANITQWFLGRLQRSDVTSYLPDGTSKTRASSFTYYIGTGLLYTEVAEPDNIFNSLFTTNEYDVFGNKNKVTLSGAYVTPRVTTTDFDTRGQLPVKTTNAVGHEEAYVYDARFGVRISLTGPNGFTTSWQYDGFGLKTREDRLDGSYTTWAYTLCETTCNYGEALNVTTTISDGAPVTTYFDMLGRELVTETIGLNNQTIYKKTVYNNRGQVDKVSAPYFATDQTYWTSYLYDDLSRVLSENRPDGSTTTFTYAGLATTSNFTGTDGISQNSTKVKNSQGQLVEVRDHYNNTSTYTYDHFGNLLTVTDAASNITIMTYDIRGNKTSMTDPDMGYWEYTYNGMGELRWQNDAKGQFVTMEYDHLGRMTRRIEPEGITTWRYDDYDTVPINDTARGKPTIITGANGDVKKLHYDTKGRLWITVTVIDGVTYGEILNYDTNSSRVLTRQQPGGLITKNIYDANGYLIQVTDNDFLNPVTYWKADESNARGQLTKETFGNNQVTARSYDVATGRLKGITTGVGTGSDIQYLQYSYDSIGNLSSRTDVNQDLLETFGYDDLNRLTGATIVGVGTRSYQYDSIGNITYKSDVGGYTYGGGGAGPHAVTNIDSSTVTMTKTVNTQDVNALASQIEALTGPACDLTNGSVNKQDVLDLLNSSIPVTNTASAGAYTYDLNGNMVTGGGRTIQWSSYNKPTQITKGDVTIDFSYGADRSRYKQVSTDGATTKTTIYVGGTYEKVSTGSSIVEKHYIFAGGKRIAVVNKPFSGSPTTQYLHADHLGSTDAITDETGAFVERLSFSPFGSRRSSNWSGASIMDNFTTNRGFTGHEHLDGVGLIHMNGRVYDPMLGRFLSADPFVQAPENAQSLNRYSYLLNNPLSGTDPSGHFWQVFVGYFLIAAAGAVIVNNIPELAPIVAIGIAIWAPFASPLADGFLAGFAGSGGDVKSGVIGAVTAGMFKYVGKNFNPGIAKVAAHGIAGGVSSVLRDGKFKSGFLSSGFTEFASPLINGVSRAADLSGRIARTLAAAVVGGTASEIGGGKFGNGAVTSAFMWMFNHESSNPHKHEMDDPNSPYRVQMGADERMWEPRKLGVCGDGLAKCDPNTLWDTKDVETIRYIKARELEGLRDVDKATSIGDFFTRRTYIGAVDSVIENRIEQLEQELYGELPDPQVVTDPNRKLR